ncbi:MAG: hypothetical protein WBA67_09075 [Jannaschia sp.]
MMRLPLEDFGKGPARAQRPALAVPPEEMATADFDTAYNAGWDDAMAQVDSEQGRIGEKLSDRLLTLEREQHEAITAAISALEPLLHEVFDKLLPRTAERAFLSVLLEEVRSVMDAGAGHMTVQVAPEEAAPLARLMDRAGLTPDQVTVTAEPALALSQALIRWENQERRVDLEAVLSALDAALETFLASVEVEPTDG